MADWKFYLTTFGCKINQYETQSISEAWVKAGGVETANPGEADFICINSCAITANAEREARNALYRLRKLAPHAQIILTGCAAQFFPEFQPRRNGDPTKPDIVIPQKDKATLYQHPLNAGKILRERPAPQIFAFPRARPIVKVQDGCTRNCSYCVVPQTRSKTESRDEAAILRECRALLADGFSELVLSGVNLLQYKTPACKDFWDLAAYLKRNLQPEFGNAFRLRVSSIDPSLLTDKAIELFQENPCICPHLHISLQHASEKILRKMRRAHYKPAEVLRKIRKLRQNGPLGLGADLLLGFPGETEDDVKILEDYCKESGFSYAHIFPFSARQNTVAKSLPNQLPASVKKERAARIAKIVAKGKNEFLQAQLKLNKCFFIAANDEKSESIRGVNEYYASCQINGADQNLLHKQIIPVRPLRVDNGVLIVEII